MIEINDRRVVYEFFKVKLEMAWTDDFRGVLFVPDEFEKKIRDFDDVSVAVCYNHFNGKTCMMHVMIQKPEHVTRKMVREVFTFPFMVCGLEHVIAPCPESNKAAIDFDTRIGFKELHKFKGGAMDGTDLVILAMSKADCKWIGKGKNNE